MISRFAVTLFVSATLLFACQPMVARMIVPLMGGAPAVWILCSLCFQALVLAGYSYAHVVGSRFSMRTQVMIQLALVGSAFLVLPVVVDEQVLATLTAKSRSLGMIAALLRSVGLPFFVLSTTSPLLQRWYAELGETDPYHLYTASNAGSMLALLGYPFAVEPFLSLHAQARMHHAAYAIYTVCIVVCAGSAMRERRAPRLEATPAPPGVTQEEGNDAPLSSRHLLSLAPERPRDRWIERAIWVGLAFAPSSMLLGATEFITTYVASVPLLWVVPLALYLASFIVAFAKRQVIGLATASRIVVLLAVAVAIAKLAGVNGPVPAIVTLHLALLFFVAVVCHRALALRRPHHSRLTQFYLLMSVGGVLGGVFNGLLAPVVFDDLYEYPIAIGLGSLGGSAVDDALASEKPAALKRDVAFALLLALVTYLVARVGERMNVSPTVAAAVFVVPVFVAFLWRKRALRFALALTSVMLVGSVTGAVSGSTLFKERDFFGVLKVRRDPSGKFLELQSGGTLHGAQAIDATGKKVPLTYYHPSGPCGDVLGRAPRVGVIGLGVGSLAAYAKPGDTWTFFELNPADIEIAKRYFTYLSDVPDGVSLDIEEGDARLRLRDGAAGRFDVLVLDAFSSDAVPLHLVTREALAIYVRALAPGGALLAHVSNRHVKLEPVFARLADDAGLLAIGRDDAFLTKAEEDAMKSPSHWLVLTSSSKAIADIGGRNAGWRPIVAPASQAVWTDDFANVLWALRF